MNAGIVVDSSALLAMLLGKPESDRMLAVLLSTHERWISAFNLLEASHLDVQVSPQTKEHMIVALFLDIVEGRRILASKDVKKTRSKGAMLCLP